MVIALLVFLLLWAVAATLPGVIVGYAFVAMSGRLSTGVRIPALLLLSAATAALWMGVLDHDGFWRAAPMGLTFLATLASGAGFLGIEAAKRRARRYVHRQRPSW
ncbi:hypothetical protein [Streptomyces sp. NPDC059072]|uniref:hypothetical protein n=1 Tax=unclassified Streptomyces TaxID=2593676 RepID=UPI00368F5B25